MRLNHKASNYMPLIRIYPIYQDSFIKNLIQTQSIIANTYLENKTLKLLKDNKQLNLGKGIYFSFERKLCSD